MRIGATPSMWILNSMQRNQAQLINPLERIASGLRINSAADDAAGMAISENMTAQIRGQRQASENVQAGLDMFHTADRALMDVQYALERMHQLSVFAANGTLSDNDRTLIQSEIDELTQLVDDTVGNSHFNKIKLFKDQATSYFTDSVISNLFDDKEEVQEATDTVSDLLDQDVAVKDIYTSINDALVKQLEKSQHRRPAGDMSVTGNSVVLQVGANEEDQVSFELGQISLRILGIEDLDVTTRERAAESISSIEDAIEKVSEHRAVVGAEINRMESIGSNLKTSTVNLEDAQSRIRDADIAKEMLNFVKLNLVTQSAENMFKLSLEMSRRHISDLVRG